MEPQQDESQAQDKSKVKWGGLVRDIAAGTAVVAGAILVIPGLSDSLGEGLKGLAGSVINLAESLKHIDVSTMANAAKDAAKASSGGSNAFSQGIGALLVKAVGLAMAFMGVKSIAKSHKVRQETSAQSFELPPELQQSFLEQHEANKAQVVMQSRMAMAGHQPAMAMAAGRGIA